MKDWKKVLNSNKSADIALLLEGTFPFVSGGVSSWVNQIISGLPDFTFSLIFLGGNKEFYGDYKYKCPDNVVHLECHYLMESWDDGPAKPHKGNKKVFKQVQKMHGCLRSTDHTIDDESLKIVMNALGNKNELSKEEFLYSQEAWTQIKEYYTSYCTDPSFVDYFWTIRTMHSPLFTLAEIVKDMPEARVLHSVSTGYAGMLGMMLERTRGLPYILSEHGIYTKERKIDLAQADWIIDATETFGTSLDDDVSYIRRLWIRFFEGIGKLTYSSTDPIISLYEGNRERQIDDGAKESRTQIIPNGIDIDRFTILRDQRPEGVPPIIALIGRVVPIKDVKTFIRSMRTICNKMPDAKGWIVGPEDEDANYASECHALAESLNLQDNVEFLGFQKVDDILKQISLIVLTSISEALPLVILEGYAAGVPALATDVGSCRELIEGNNEEDRAFGLSGRVVQIASPEETASAAIELLSDEKLWKEAQAAAIKRVERFYTQKDMFSKYHDIYCHALGRD
jgi:polysaccharide biosynthesis protein PelF